MSIELLARKWIQRKVSNVKQFDKTLSSRDCLGEGRPQEPNSYRSIAKDAKQRQQESPGGKGERLLKEKFPEAIKGQSRDFLAKRANR